MKNLLLVFRLALLISLVISLDHSRQPNQHRGYVSLSDIVRSAAYRDLVDGVSCHANNMTVKILKEQFIDLPFSLFVVGADGKLYDAMGVAPRCSYVVEETDRYVLLTTPYNGCYVQRRGDVASLVTVVRGTVDGGRIEVTERIPVSCRIPPLQPDNVGVKNQSSSEGVPHQHCDKDGFFNIVVHRNATVPDLLLETVQVAEGRGAGCTPTRMSPESVAFRFPLTSCGSRIRFSNGKMIYSVDIKAEKKILSGRRGSILRDSSFKLTVSCMFLLIGSAQLNTDVQKKTQAETAVMKSEGALHLELRLAKDSSYGAYYSPRDHPVVRVLRQPVFAEVRVLNREDPDLQLQLGDCWATPSRDPGDPRRWTLLQKGCPYTGDNYKTELQPVLAGPSSKFPNHRKRFRVTMFSFVDSQSTRNFHGSVYFHCEAEVCKGGTGCTLSCTSRKRRARDRWNGRISSRHSVVSGGPFFIL
nr:PREDICTED: zona pellucida sperm-binding protein 4-like [Lepisosteus oculatus]